MILKKVKDFIRRYDLIKKDDKIVVAVSGGPDSVALLYLLNSLKKEFCLQLHIAHLDHMLRKDSFKDRVFVERLAERLRLPISCAQINVGHLRKYGSTEQIARNVRLAFLFGVARKVKAKKIALGHNFDDRVETVLMRIIRGSGLSGLRGLLPKREVFGFIIIRPLLGVSRKEIQNYLKRKKIKPCCDYTNLQDIYLRNRLRHKLLPILEKEYNPNIREVLANMSENIGYDYDYILKISRRIFSKEATFYGRRKISFDLGGLGKLEPALQRMLIRLGIEYIKGNLRQLDYRHMREIEDLLYQRPPNSIVDLPKGISVIKTKRSICICKR